MVNLQFNKRNKKDQSKYKGERKIELMISKNFDHDYAFVIVTIIEF